MLAAKNKSCVLSGPISKQALSNENKFCNSASFVKRIETDSVITVKISANHNKRPYYGKKKSVLLCQAKCNSSSGVQKCSGTKTKQAEKKGVAHISKSE